MFKRTLPHAALLAIALCAGAAAQQQPVIHADEAKPPRKAEAAQKTEQKADGASRYTAERYAELLAKLKKGERTIDFTELRMSYAETKDYNPYGGDRDAHRAMFAALNSSQWDEALKQSAKLLEKNYVDINAHFGAFAASARKGDTAKADFHKYVFEGLIKSVQSPGDGKSVEQAYVVISTDEEYALLNYLGLRPEGQALLNSGGHSYDKMSAVDPKTNQRYEYFFQIDKPFGWLGKSLK